MKLFISVSILLFTLCSCKNERRKVLETWENGNPKLERTSFQGDNSKFVERRFYRNGLIEYEINFKDSLKDGNAVYFYKNEKKKSQENYSNGKLNGDVIEYFENGTLKVTGKFENNEPVGITKRFYENGKIEKEVFYKGNKIPYLVNYWDTLGNQQIKNGSGKIMQRTTLNNIAVREEGFYIDTMRVGTWKYYDLRTGKLIQECDFENNRPTTVRNM